MGNTEPEIVETLSSEEIYHDGKNYPLLPSSTASEAARLSDQHQLWYMSLGNRLYLSPLNLEKACKVILFLP